MKRFTVSLDDETYERLTTEAKLRTPPATLQQMLRHAVDGLLDGPPSAVSHDDTDETPESDGNPVDPATPSDPARSDLSTFRIGDVWFGLPVGLVEGIAARSSVVALPLARHDLLGTIRYRDGLIAVIDASSALGAHRNGADDGQHLVVRQAGGLVALVVDEVGALISEDTGSWHTPPAGTEAELAGLGVTAMVDCGDRIVSVLESISA